MNAQIRRLTILVIVMFLVLLVAVTNIQFFQAPKLRADSRNSRTIFEAAGRDRGQIIVAGKAIASSQPSDDAFKYTRIYSNGELYAPLTGYYSANLSSTTGLEREANDILIGDAPSLLSQRIQRLFTGREPQGSSIELTIDPILQQAAWDAIDGRRGAAVAIDPKTGAILAAVSSPSFDPNKIVTHDKNKALDEFKRLENDPRKPLDNRAFGGHRYAPGSTFKIITAAALLSEGKLKPEDNIDAPDSIQLPNSDSKLYNAERQVCGDRKPTFEYAFAYSCNTPFVLQAMDLGQEKMKEMAEAFGFNEGSSMPLPVAKSVYPTDLKLDPSYLGMSAIGQYDVEATPLKMAQVTATVANGGTMMAPYLIKRVLDPDLNERQVTKPSVESHPISQAVANDLQTMMVATVKYGTGKTVAIDGYEIAAKTGTAEVGDTGKVNAWFVGYAPVDNPTIALAVVIEGGQDDVPSAYSSVLATPIARQMFQAHRNASSSATQEVQ